MLFDTDEAATPVPVRETTKQKARRDWDEIRSAANDFLRANSATLDGFRGRLTALFDAMRGDKEPFKKRPNISLRLIAAGSPTAKVITVPHVRYDPTGGYLVPTAHTIELLEQKELKVEHRGEEKDAMQFRRKLRLHNDPHRPPTVGAIYKSAAEDARRIVDTIREFLDDSRAVLARGCDHCCICGRGLTDELSRSRGIGPECIQRGDVVAALVGPEASKFIVPETIT
jgi:hypothetical protein